MGLVNQVFPQDGFLDPSMPYARELVKNVSPRSMRVIKDQVYHAMFQTLGEAFETAEDGDASQSAMRGLPGRRPAFSREALSGLHREVAGHRMEFEFSPKVKALQERLRAFMDQHVYPNEQRYEDDIDSSDRWQPSALVEELKAKARGEGLWNLFELHATSSMRRLCEIMGRSAMAAEVFNCSAPDTGNMEVLARYGTPEQQERWLKPLLDGEIRSCFSMTEPDVASSDATNIQASIVRDGDEYVINGRKWWSSGAGDPRCKIAIFMGKTDPTAARHKQQSMILVPLDTPGVKIERMLTVFGYDHAPHGHGEISFTDVRVPAVQHAAGRRPRVRDRAGAAGAGPHPPLHADDRRG